MSLPPVLTIAQQGTTMIDDLPVTADKALVCSGRIGARKITCLLSRLVQRVNLHGSDGFADCRQ
jgi:hypothetical protein